MKPISIVMCAAAVLAGCSINSSSPPTAWGKVGVSMLDYRTDGGQCAVLAATANGKEGSNTGIHGESSSKSPANVPNGSAQAGSAAATGGAVGGAGASSSATTNSGSMYRDNASPEFVNRAAEQQRSQEMAAQRYRNDMLKSCLTTRGYTEFELTPQQRAELAQLPQGSEERRAYLYKLGTDAEVLKKQSVPQQK